MAKGVSTKSFSPVVLAATVAPLCAMLLCSCSGGRAVEAKETPPVRQQVSGPREIRATGTIQAVRANTIQVPQLAGAQTRITLVRIVPNGSTVRAGDMLAEFDRTQLLDAARDAKAQFEDLTHQVRQKEAQNANEREKRSADLTAAEAELSKAEIQLKKGPVLSEIERQKNEVKASSARLRVESLRKIDALKTTAETAALNILMLQRQRQQVALDRATRNADLLVMKAPIGGMVALENLFKQGTLGPPREGDQLFTGQPLMKLFDSSEMEVRTLIGEPDSALLKEGTLATVYLDAYPDAVLRARFFSASPVATAAIGSPIKNFTARFRVEGSDPRLLPDLSAAVVLKAER